MAYIFEGIAIAASITVAVILLRKTAKDLVSGRIRSASTTDHVQAIEQIQAMRGTDHERTGAWDGFDRLDGAGADHGGGAI